MRFLGALGPAVAASLLTDQRHRAATAGPGLKLHPHVTYLLLRLGSPQESVTSIAVTNPIGSM